MFDPAGLAPGSSIEITHIRRLMGLVAKLR
jgi:hypothetical protein